MESGIFKVKQYDRKDATLLCMKWRPSEAPSGNTSDGRNVLNRGMSKASTQHATSSLQLINNFDACCRQETHANVWSDRVHKSTNL